MDEQDLIEHYCEEFRRWTLRGDNPGKFGVEGFDHWLNITGEAQDSGLTAEEFAERVRLAGYDPDAIMVDKVKP